MSQVLKPRKYRAYGKTHLDRIPELAALPEEQRLAIRAVASVLPFKTNNYVVEDLIDWDRVPDDPIYRLTFPHPDMLDRDDFTRMRDLVANDAAPREIRAAANEIRMRLNPHPAGQMELYVPRVDGEPIPGLQHKYRETVLFFPRQGQTCHAYCTYCFRWPQFVGEEELKFANNEAESLTRYLRRHPEVTDVLFTGGDPGIIRATVLRRYVEPLLQLEHLQTIRIGTKSVAWWPYRYLTDPDADDLMRLFEEVVASGRHLALMAHYSHPRELSTPASQAALQRILRTGAVVRCQAPLIRHVNDDPDVWASLWNRQIALGAVPYYMFIERDTGPKRYFEVPLARALDIFTNAWRRVSGLGRTVRGPSMSCTPGKVMVEGITRLHGEKVFVLKFIQGRVPDWANRIFFARYDEQATWIDDLVPALGASEFFFEPTLRELGAGRRALPWLAKAAPQRPLAPRAAPLFATGEVAEAK